MADLRDAITALERLVATTKGVADEGVRAEASAVLDRVRSRRGFLGESVLVALVGGTGSGKSSLLNAIAGKEVAEAGSRRPMTTVPQAWIPSRPEPLLLGLLDEIGITRRTSHDLDNPLVLIDLPDIDSVEETHRSLVERLIPQVDAIVWVMDPEKYQDRVLHTQHIEPLAAYKDRFVFVLNQADRVATGDLDSMVEDLRSRLQSEGIPDPMILTTSADPPAGPPWGTEALLEAIGELGTARQIVNTKTVVDVREAATRLAREAGLGEHLGEALDEMWQAKCDEVAETLVTSGLGSRLRREAARFGEERGRAAVSLRPPANLPEVAVTTDWGFTGVGGAVSELNRFIEALRPPVAGETTAALEQVSASLEDELQAALEYSVSGAGYRLPRLPKWVGILRWVRVGAMVAVPGLLFWAFLLWRGGENPVGVLIGAAICLSSILMIPGVSGWIGKARARGEVDSIRKNLTVILSREIERRVGRPLRKALRKHQMATGALSEFRQIMNLLGTGVGETRDAV